ncbi:F510_1955 family glycosylhydrolase [uncultured Cellulomonas sp.]|uniref:F510_1955 family glycosylhydrolase n=1 Tax=uncultured Cellulomonas sp. TaxID=189682 RepID=UPI00260F2ABD|nr:exo-alpha-sialidase [uncultured Cellulomonas sp.]
MHPHHRTTVRALASLGLVAAVLAGCAGTPRAGTAPPPGPAVSAGPGPADAGAAAGEGLPSSHVHGVAVNPADGLVYLASHDGLFRYGADGPQRVGPVIDLMGFTVAGPDHFYSSGHPSPGVDLPTPLGLVESTDAGQTWQPLSRGGQSDFHALTASTAAVVGYDGSALRSTTDGQTWTDLDAPVEPFALAASRDGRVLVLTSQAGVYRSGDGGATWQQPQAPLLQYVAFADDTVAVGVTPDGDVARSDDAGQTWTQVGALGEPVAAVGATRGPDDTVRVVAVTADQVLESSDGGATFGALTTK